MVRASEVASSPLATDWHAELDDFAQITSDWFWQLDPELRFIRISDRVEESTGLPAAHFLGRSVLEIGLRGIDRPATQRQLAAFGAQQAFRGSLGVWDGPIGRRYFRISGLPIHAAGGAFAGFRGAATDVTAEFEARRSAEAAHLRLTEAVEAFPDGFALYDRDDRLVLCNTRYREVYAESAEVIVPGNSFETILRYGLERGQYPAALGREEAWLEERLRQHRTLDMVVEQQLASGRWVRISERSTRDGGRVGVRADITELKRREAALRASELQLKTITDSIPEAVISIDTQGRIQFASRACQDVLGYQPAALVGQPLGQIIPERFRQEHERRMAGLRAGAVAGQAGTTAELIVARGDGGERAVEISFAQWRREDATFFTGVLRDISERKRAEAERAALQEQLFRAQKLDALGTLAGGIAHDFNNILGIMLGNAEYLAMDLPAGDPNRDCIDAIMRAGDRAKALVRQILAFGRPQSHGLEPIRLDRLLQEELDLLRATLPSSIDIRRAASGEPLVIGDRTQIQQLIVNLCVNASLAIGDATGRIDVDLDAVTVDCTAAGRDAGEPDAVELEIGSGDRSHVMRVGRPGAGRYVRLRVRDTGCGMGPDVLGRIFDPFFTTREVGRGTGLGLSVVHGIVTSHGASIEVRSREGAGTTFTILMPLAAASVGDDAPVPIAPAVPSGAGRILVVDDEAFLLKTAARSLGKAGYTVSTEASPLVALERVRAAPDSWDAVITDQTMPGMTGFELAVQLLRLRPGLPIVLVTGFSAGVDEARARSAGIAAFAHKPIVGSQLAATVRRVLEPATAADRRDIIVEGRS